MHIVYSQVCCGCVLHVHGLHRSVVGVLQCFWCVREAGAWCMGCAAFSCATGALVSVLFHGVLCLVCVCVLLLLACFVGAVYMYAGP